MPDNTSKLTRRRFLTTTAGGLVSASLLNLTSARTLAQDSDDDATATPGNIIHRTLGRTGLNVPIVSMGVMNASNPEIVQASYEIGIRHFDTAAYYQFGRNEQMVGSVLNRLKARDKIVLASKIHTPGQRRGLQPEESKKKLIDACEASLRRLGTDYLDILYVHDVGDPETVADKAIIEGMQILKEQKKVLYTGIATHTRMNEVIDAVVQGSFYDVVLTAINFTMADNTALLESISKAAEQGVAIVAMKALAGGARWPNPQARQSYSSSTIATAALKWVLRNESIATSIPGYTNYEHMQEDFSVVRNLEYTDEEKKLLSDNNVKLSLGYCHQCRRCLATCPEGVDIPNLMRTHMYAAQYGNFHQARATLNDIPGDAGLRLCNDCSGCQAQCANTVDIAHRIEELKIIYC